MERCERSTPSPRRGGRGTPRGAGRSTPTAAAKRQGGGRGSPRPRPWLQMTPRGAQQGPLSVEAMQKSIVLSTHAEGKKGEAKGRGSSSSSSCTCFVNLPNSGLADDMVPDLVSVLALALSHHKAEHACVRAVNMTLLLEGNCLGDSGIEALVDALLGPLKATARPRILRLHKNAIGDAGAAALGRLLANGALEQPVKEIHLSHNVITSQGLAAMLGPLSQNDAYPIAFGSSRAPLWLRLEYNSIEDVAGVVRALLPPGGACTVKRRGGECDVGRCGASAREVEGGRTTKANLGGDRRPKVHLPYAANQRRRGQALFAPVPMAAGGSAEAGASANGSAARAAWEAVAATGRRVFVVLDTSALLAMLQHEAGDPLGPRGFTFQSLLQGAVAAGAAAEAASSSDCPSAAAAEEGGGGGGGGGAGEVRPAVVLLLLQTVWNQLDGLKAREPKLRHLINRFFGDGGLLQRCDDAELLIYVDPLDAETPAHQSPLVAAVGGRAADGSLDSDGLIIDCCAVLQRRVREALGDAGLLVLLTADKAMLSRARAVGVPCDDVHKLESRLRKRFPSLCRSEGGGDGNLAAAAAAAALVRDADALLSCLSFGTHRRNEQTTRKIASLNSVDGTAGVKAALAAGEAMAAALRCTRAEEGNDSAGLLDAWERAYAAIADQVDAGWAWSPSAAFDGSLFALPPRRSSCQSAAAGPESTDSAAKETEKGFVVSDVDGAYDGAARELEASGVEGGADVGVARATEGFALLNFQEAEESEGATNIYDTTESLSARHSMENGW